MYNKIVCISIALLFIFSACKKKDDPAPESLAKPIPPGTTTAAVTDKIWSLPLDVRYFEQGIVLYVLSTGHLSRSVDNGLTWEVVLEVSGGNINKFFSSDFFNTFDFYDRKHGVLTGQNNNRYLIATTDGGVTWDTLLEFSYGVTIGAQVADAEMIDERKIIYGSEQGGLLFTDDYGKTWDQVLSSIALTGNDQGEFQITFPDPEHGYTLAGDQLFSSSDSGRTWKILKNNMPVPANNGGIMRFSSALKGIISGNGAIYSTIDGGLNWSLVDLNRAGAFYILDDLNLYIVNDGDIYHSSDWGKSTQLLRRWQDQPPYSFSTILPVMFTTKHGLSIGNRVEALASGFDKTERLILRTRQGWK